ncbi:MAG: hypothetical protein LIP08_07655 [Bacteroides sp.]|nr:hypothetical protein [Bacteroides sp.]
MNNSESRTTHVVQTDHVSELVERANRESLNWLPLIEFFTQETAPEELAKTLLDFYFSVSEFAADNLPGESGIYIAGEHLYCINRIIKLCQEMTKQTESAIKFIQQAKRSSTEPAKDHESFVLSAERVKHESEIDLLNKLLQGKDDEICEQAREIGHLSKEVELLQKQLNALQAKSTASKPTQQQTQQEWEIQRDVNRCILCIHANNRVIVTKQAHSKLGVVYSVEIPEFSQKVFLKSQTASKVIDILRVLLSNDEIESGTLKKICKVVDLSEFRKKRELQDLRMIQ